MTMPLFRVLATGAAAAALIAGSAGSVLADTAPASQQSTSPGQALKAGLTGTQDVPVQQRINRYLTAHPDARQVAANKVAIPGGSMTPAAPGAAADPNSAQLACSNGHLCIRDGNGDIYDYYYCGYYDFYGVGDGVFNNNQTWGTVARFYNQNGSLRWTNTAKDSGTASWTPVWHIRPC